MPSILHDGVLRSPRRLIATAVGALMVVAATLIPAAASATAEIPGAITSVMITKAQLASTGAESTWPFVVIGAALALLGALLLAARKGPRS